MGPQMVELGMKPEDITGIDEDGNLVHVESCTCDYVEAREGFKVDGRFALKIRGLVTYRDTNCAVHKSVA